MFCERATIVRWSLPGRPHPLQPPPTHPQTQLLAFDNVISKQRQELYGIRAQIVQHSADQLHSMARDFARRTTDDIVEANFETEKRAKIVEKVRQFFPTLGALDDGVSACVRACVCAWGLLLGCVGVLGFLGLVVFESPLTNHPMSKTLGNPISPQTLKFVVVFVVVCAWGPLKSFGHRPPLLNPSTPPPPNTHTQTRTCSRCPSRRRPP